MDLCTVYEDFVAYLLAEGASDLTATAYRSDFRKLMEYLESVQQQPALANLTAPTIRRYMVWLRERDYKPWSIRRRVGSLRSFMNYCVDEGLIPTHPMQRISTPKAPSSVPRYLTSEEVRKILQAIDRHKSLFRRRDQALVRVMLYCGLRRSEILAMKWEDVDLDHGTLLVHGKGRKERVLPLEAETHRFLSQYWVEFGGKPHEAVWRNRESRSLQKDSLTTRVQRWITWAGLTKHVTPHVWRHTCATLLIQHGASVRTVQEMLGHADLATTSVYTHSDPIISRQSVQRLALSFGASSD